MQIHVITSGESLYGIANTYNTTTQALIDANELDAPNNLVVGQALVIPIIGQFYFVQPGDSLYSIAQQFGISYQELAQINNFPPGNILPVGFRLYIPPVSKSPITTNAYIEPTGGTVSETLENAATKTTPYLTYLAIFSYRVGRDGSLTPPPLNGLSEIAQQNNAAKMLVVTNLEEGEFSQELGHIIVTVQSVQNTLLDNIVNTATTGGYSDVHFDFEFLPPEDREAYNNFLRKAKERLSQAGLLMSTALAPKTSATQTGQWYEAHDYAAHGEIADFVVLMTYEWGYSYGPPMAVSPLDQVREVVEYALTEMPADKILLGQNLYGYDWTLPYEEGGEAAQAVSPQQAITIARENNAEIKFDEGSQAPYFTYTDNEGNQHEVWFEDARSIQAKFNLIKELGLLGISYWKLGLAFPQNWLLLQDQFDIEKMEP
ncbi:MULTISPECIES: glycoside hydrolase family 18 protein [Virgibacillus]|uniref:Spore germination protein YaaH n=2 Tax=Virgibacillus TaxID=84406 RepID=A0A024Q678_9BACI|nr:MULTISPECIES: glycoside hydrolase family 18 protein [Virgibacillus]EQB38679.1 spore germination protein [Virgibacillus sp. CM-4]GGJ56805.1 spore germination protein YaaH [Virgibacillus kapii]CDQ37812.1 Spore germination protein YaaH [Virgibacillus massiliensis]